MIKKIIFNILIIIIISANSLLSQNNNYNKEVFTLEDCIEYAIKNTPKYKIQEALNKNTEIEYKETYLKFIPQINGAIGLNTNFGRSINPETNTYDYITNLNNVYSISASTYLFNGLSKINNFKIAKLLKAIGNEESEIINKEINLNITKAYYNALYTLKLVNLHKEQLENSKNNFIANNKKFELGLISEVDKLNSKAIYASDEHNYLTSQNNYDKAILELKAIMFYPFDSTLNIDTVVNYNNDIIIDDYSNTNNINDINDINNINDKDNINDINSINNVVNKISNNMPQVKKAEQKVKIQQYKLKTAKLSSLPSIYIQGGYNTGYISNLKSDNNIPFWQQIKDLQGQYINLGIQIPIFNALSYYNNKNIETNKLEIEKNNYNEILYSIKQEVYSAFLDLQNAKKAYISATEKAEAQKMAHKFNTKKFNEGLISILEYRISNNEYLTSQAEALNLFLDLKLKQKVIELYEN